MKRRLPVPHTPPPTSKVGPRLMRALGDGLGLEWHWRDSKGIIHQTAPQPTAPHLGMTVCLIDHKLDQTLAPVTCLWCIAERSFWR